MNEKGIKWAELSIGEAWEEMLRQAMLRQATSVKRKQHHQWLFIGVIGSCLLLGWSWLIVNLCWVAFGH